MWRILPTIVQPTEPGVTGQLDSGNGNRLTLEPAIANDADLYTGQGFPTLANTFEERTDNSATTATNETEFTGTFNGIPGKYSCVATCKAERNAKDEITLSATTWRFTPDVVPPGGTAHMVMGVDHDNDYMSFGYWVQSTEKANGEIASAVGTFADGSEPFTNIAALVARRPIQVRQPACL